jgi:hypothetical protein
MMKPRRRSVGHWNAQGRREMIIKFQSEYLKGRDHLLDLGVNGGIILK